LFLNKFIIDDPLWGLSFKNFERINSDLQARGYNPITESQAKMELFDTIQYMRDLLPGVQTYTGYIKFYPLSKEPEPELLKLINVPDLSFPSHFPDVFKWFFKKIIIQTVDDNHQTTDLIEPCKQLAISFIQDENFSVFLPAFMQRTILSGGKYRDTNIIPPSHIFSKWKEEEVIKSIRDRFIELVRKNWFRLKFGALISTESNFEYNFLRSVIKEPELNSPESNIINVVTKMSIPSIKNASFKRVMEIRQFFDEEFENFRTELKADIKLLQSLHDEKELANFSKSLGEKYEEKIRKIESWMKFKFNFSGFDFIPTGLDIAAILTASEIVPMSLTGINILIKLFEASVVRPREIAKSNPCFFLYKLKS
jgi:hypothetical protein